MLACEWVHVCVRTCVCVSVPAWMRVRVRTCECVRVSRKNKQTKKQLSKELEGDRPT